MHLLVAVLLTVAHYVSVTNADCCFPLQFEGERFIVEDHVVKTFSVDFNAQRIFETANPDTEVFDIWDLENNKLYHWNGTTCSFKDSALPIHFPPCLMGEHMLFTLGDEQNRIQTNGLHIMEDDSHSFFVVNDKSTACIPIFSQTIVNDLVHTALFKHVRLGINNRKIYTPFDGCVEVERTVAWSEW